MSIKQAVSSVFGSPGSEGGTSFLPSDYIVQKAESRANIVCLILFGTVLFGVVGAFLVTHRAWNTVREQQRQINAEYTWTKPSSPSGDFAVIADFGQVGPNWPPYGASPTLPTQPWSSTSVINFSGVWDVTVPGAIDGMTINAGDAYSGSFEFDLAPNGDIVNVVVNFTLSEAP